MHPPSILSDYRAQLSCRSQSRQVPEQVWVLLVSFQIVTCYQILNPLLDCLEVRLHKAHLLKTKLLPEKKKGKKMPLNSYYKLFSLHSSLIQTQP